MFVTVALNWPNLPESIPSHYNASGEADRWGSKAGVWMLPVVGAVLFLVLTLLKRVASPARQMLTAVKLVMIVTFAYISWIQVTAPGQGLGRAFLPSMLIAPMVVIGFYFFRLRRH